MSQNDQTHFKISQNLFFLKIILGVMEVNLPKVAQPIKCQCHPHLETSQLICCANQLTCFYTRETLAFNGLILEAKFDDDP